MKTDKLITIETLCAHYQINPGFVTALNEIGLIETIQIQDEQFIDTVHLVRIERIIRLHEDLEINLEGIEVIDRLLDRLDLMRKQIIILENKLQRFESC
jgi:chaperone modulatory protein CbpM